MGIYEAAEIQSDKMNRERKTRKDTTQELIFFFKVVIFFHSVVSSTNTFEFVCVQAGVPAISLCLGGPFLK